MYLNAIALILVSLFSSSCEKKEEVNWEKLKTESIASGVSNHYSSDRLTDAFNYLYAFSVFKLEHLSEKNCSNQKTKSNCNTKTIYNSPSFSLRNVENPQYDCYEKPTPSITSAGFASSDLSVEINNNSDGIFFEGNKCLNSMIRNVSRKVTRDLDAKGRLVFLKSQRAKDAVEYTREYAKGKVIRENYIFSVNDITYKYNWVYKWINESKLEKTLSSSLEIQSIGYNDEIELATEVQSWENELLKNVDVSFSDVQFKEITMNDDIRKSISKTLLRNNVNSQIAYELRDASWNHWFSAQFQYIFQILLDNNISLPFYLFPKLNGNSERLRKSYYYNQYNGENYFYHNSNVNVSFRHDSLGRISFMGYKHELNPKVFDLSGAENNNFIKFKNELKQKGFVSKDSISISYKEGANQYSKTFYYGLDSVVSNYFFILPEENITEIVKLKFNPEPKEAEVKNKANTNFSTSPFGNYDNLKDYLRQENFSLNGNGDVSFQFNSIRKNGVIIVSGGGFRMEGDVKLIGNKGFEVSDYRVVSGNVDASNNQGSFGSFYLKGDGDLEGELKDMKGNKRHYLIKIE